VGRKAGGQLSGYVVHYHGGLRAELCKYALVLCVITTYGVAFEEEITSFFGRNRLGKRKGKTLRKFPWSRKNFHLSQRSQYNYIVELANILIS
jgi:hypothetical protein